MEERRRVVSVLKLWGIIVPKARHAQTTFCWGRPSLAWISPKRPQRLSCLSRARGHIPSQYARAFPFESNYAEYGCDSLHFYPDLRPARQSDGCPTRFPPRVFRSAREAAAALIDDPRWQLLSWALKLVYMEGLTALQLW